MEGLTETAVPLPNIVYVPGDRSASQALDGHAVPEPGHDQLIGALSSLPLLGAEPQLLAPHLKVTGVNRAQHHTLRDEAPLSTWSHLAGPARAAYAHS